MTMMTTNSNHSIMFGAGKHVHVMVQHRTVCRLILLIFFLIFIGNVLPNANEDVSEDYIREQVAKEIISQVQTRHENFINKKNLLKDTTNECIIEQSPIYLQPYWPVYSPYFRQTDQVQLLFNANIVSQAYKGNGGTQNLSKLIFGQTTIHVKDILLASSLVGQGKLGNTDLAALQGNVPGDPANAQSTQANYYLGILADQVIDFDTSYQDYIPALSYTRHFKKSGVKVGFHLPFKIRHHCLKLTNDISQQNNSKLQNIMRGYSADGTTPIAGLDADANLQFYEQYSSFEDFITQILAAKEISFNKEATVFGPSDVSVFSNITIPTQYFDALVLGFNLQLPTGQKRDPNKLWPNDLGNGGFVEASMYGSFLWEVRRFFNPYVHVSGTYVFKASVSRRVPVINTYDGTELNGKVIPPGATLAESLVLGDSLTLGLNNIAGGNTFSQPDSTIRQFADTARKVEIHPGTRFFCRIGNSFKEFFSKRSFLDLYYDLCLKGKDHVGNSNANGLLYTSVLTRNTSQVAHTLGLDYSYQFNSHYRLRVGGSYLFAGRNIQKIFDARCGLNIEF